MARNAKTPPPGTVTVEQYVRKYSEHSLQLLPMALRTVSFQTGEAQVPVAANSERGAEACTKETEERAKRLNESSGRSTSPCGNRRK